MGKMFLEQQENDEKEGIRVILNSSIDSIGAFLAREALIGSVGQAKSVLEFFKSDSEIRQAIQQKEREIVK